MTAPLGGRAEGTDAKGDGRMSDISSDSTWFPDVGFALALVAYVVVFLLALEVGKLQQRVERLEAQQMVGVKR